MNSSFVRAQGGRLTLDGQPFPVRGANNYYLGFESDAMVETVFDLAGRMGLNALRTWAFLDCGGAPANATPANAKDGVFFRYFNSTDGRVEFNDGPNGLERLDRTIAWAEQRNIRLILPLVNYWPDFGGVDQYLEWLRFQGVALPARDRFYRHPAARRTYRDGVEHLLLRVNTKTGRQYREEPAILAWELANEPRCVTADGTAVLAEWVGEMSAFVKSLDANHLVGVGDEGYFKRSLAFNHELYNGSFGVDCEALLGVPTVDFGTCHLYPSMSPNEDAIAFGTRWVREHIEAGDRANKPMLIEEFGLTAGAPHSRDDAFGAWLKQVAASHGAGAAVWMIAGAGYPDYDHYTVYSETEVPALMGNWDDGLPAAHRAGQA